MCQSPVIFKDDVLILFAEFRCIFFVVVQYGRRLRVEVKATLTVSSAVVE